VLEQRVHVYRSQNGANWDDSVSANLPPTNAQRAALGLPPDPVFGDQGRLERHPSFAIGSDGTAYLAFLESPGLRDCSSFVPDGPVDVPTREYELELWQLAPGGAAFERVACDVLDQNGTCDDAATSIVSDGDDAGSVLAVVTGFDTPRVAADPTADPLHLDPTHPDRLVFTYAIDFVGFISDGAEDVIVTLERQGNGAWSRVEPPGRPQPLDFGQVVDGIPRNDIGASSFPNPVFDAAGELFVAQALGVGPIVQHLSRDASGKWQDVANNGPQEVGPGQPTGLAGDQEFAVGVPGQIFTSLVRIDPTPALAVANVAGEETMFLAYATESVFGRDGNGVQIAKAKTSDLRWSTPLQVDPGRLGAFSPVLSLDADTNTLDLVYYVNETPQNLSVDTVFQRLTADTLTRRAGPTVVSAGREVIADFPRLERDQLNGLDFLGDHATVVTTGRKAIIGWPEYNGSTSFGTPNADLTLGFVDSVCGDLASASGPLTIAGRADTVWECDCACGGAKSELVGCAPASATAAAAACSHVCIGSDCGAAQSCGGPRSCSALGSGRALFTQGCDASFGPASGGQPSLFADYFANALPDSSAQFFDGGTSATTSLGGAVALNVAGGTPGAGAEVEIARLAVTPASFHAGGTLGAQIRDIRLAHLERLRGTFIDDRHFQIPAGSSELLMSFVVDPDGPDFLTGNPETHRLVATNDTPILGTLDLSTGELFLDLAFGTTTGFTGTFHGKLAPAPVDTDGDGIPDAIDDCPKVPNPDQSVPPPDFAPVHDVTAAVCVAGDSVALMPPVATDLCTPDVVSVDGVLISSNGVPYNPPLAMTNHAAVLPLGSTIVEWDAKNGNNLSRSVRQTIQVSTRAPLEVRGAASLSDRSEVRFADGREGPVLNTGRLFSQVGVQAKLGDLSSVPGVTVADRAQLGAIRSEAGIQLGNGVTTGTTTPNTQLSLPDPLDLSSVAFPAGNQGDVSVATGAVTLAPGSYGNVVVAAGQTLVLSAGSYFFVSLELFADSRVRVADITAPVALYVQSTLVDQGRIVDANDQNKPVFVGYFGTSDVVLERDFRGTLVAPHATVRAGAGSDLAFSATFTAASFELRPDAVLTCDASATALGGLAPTAPGSCTDRQKDGAETDVDCGGYVCGGCANGKACAFGEDCASGTCTSGTCTTGGALGASIQVTSNWAAGYCVNLQVHNGSTLPTKHFSVRVDTRASSISSSWSGAFTKKSGVIDVTPVLVSNQVIAPGSSDTSIGFCANRNVSGSGVLPAIVATGATF
jgi:hypothetical protein